MMMMMMMSNEGFIVLFVFYKFLFLGRKKNRNLCTPKIQKGGYHRECFKDETTFIFYRYKNDHLRLKKRWLVETKKKSEIK